MSQYSCFNEVVCFMYRPSQSKHILFFFFQAMNLEFQFQRTRKIKWKEIHPVQLFGKVLSKNNLGLKLFFLFLPWFSLQPNWMIREKNHWKDENLQHWMWFWNLILALFMCHCNALCASLVLDCELLIWLIFINALFNLGITTWSFG